MPLLLELAWGDLRSSGRSLVIFVVCLALGVTLIAATGGLYRLINQSLLADTRILLGGDVEVDSDEPLPATALDWMEENGDVSLVTELDTMLGTSAGEFLRVELQVMDDRYPLYGDLALVPAMPLSNATANDGSRWGAAVDAALAERVGLQVGDTIYIGNLEMLVRALVTEQPDRSLSADWRGAPVLLSYGALDASGLVGPGSRVDYDYRVRTVAPADDWRERFYAEFPGESWDVRTFEDRSRRISERLDQLASGLMIIACSTLFIGGLGVFNSISAYLRGKRKTIAMLRAVGLRNGRVALVYLLQVGMLGTGASILGVALGSALALAGGGVVARQIPLTASAATLALPGVTAILFGLLTAYAFALPAVGRALAVRPAVLFRGDDSDATPAPGAWKVATALCSASVVSMLMATLPDRRFALGFVLTVALLLLLLDFVVKAVRAIARRLEKRTFVARRFVLQLALANLQRPGAPLRASLLSLGSALTLLVACTLVVASLLRTINDTIPEEAPALVLYDIPDPDLDAVVAAAREPSSAQRIDTTPLVRARIDAVNDRPLREIYAGKRERLRDVSQDEYKLSYIANNIDDVTLVDGAWWTEPVTGIPRMAMEDREARQLDLGVGDTVTFLIEGRRLDAEIAAIYSQKGLQTRFWFEGILSDGALDGFIHRHVGAAYLDDADAVAAQRNISRIAPTVVTVRTAALLTAARDVLGKAATALAVVAGLSLAASLMVLVSVIAAGRSRQVYDATVLHSLGTRLGVIRQSLHVEYLLLATVTSGFAVCLGAAIALPLLELKLKLPSNDLLWIGVVVAVSVSSLSLALGARYLMRRLKPEPALLLRAAGG